MGVIAIGAREGVLALANLHLQRKWHAGASRRPAACHQALKLNLRGTHRQLRAQAYVSDIDEDGCRGLGGIQRIPAATWIAPMVSAAAAR